MRGGGHSGSHLQRKEKVALDFPPPRPSLTSGMLLNRVIPDAGGVARQQRWGSGAGGAMTLLRL